MIFISAGHYPKRYGASFKGFNEHDEAVMWAIMINDYITVESNLVPVGKLKSKTAYINSHITNDNLAMEIHFNSAKKNTAEKNKPPVWVNIGNGCETLYYPNSVNGKVFADIVNDAIAKSFQPNRGIKEGYYQMNPKNKADYFLLHTKCPAIIIEPEFIHKKESIQKNRNACCLDIAEALVKAKELIYHN